MATQINSNGYRTYKTPAGKQYPSITTVLSKTSDMTGLNRWKNRVGKSVAQYIMEEAGEIGTQTHQLCEDYLNNTESKINPRLISKAHFENLKPLLDKINNIRCTETALYSDQYEIAGTVDCIAEYNGVPSIIDFKTSRSKLVESYDKTQKYFIQGTAYSLMFTERTGIPIKQVVILCSDEKGGVAEFIKSPDNYKEKLIEKLKSFKFSKF